MAKQKQPPGPRMTLGNMRDLGLALVLGLHFNEPTHVAERHR